MFDKMLLSLVSGIMPLIVESVAAKWIALLCNIAIIATIGNVFAALLAGVPASGVGAATAATGVAGAAAFDARAAMTLAMLIIVRAIAIYAAQRAGDKAAFAAKRQVRQLVYDKLVQMGPAYREQVSTAEAVQTSVEGAQQLEVYFGGYLPQLFYAVLAPVTLFAAPPRALRWRCCSWRPAPSAFRAPFWLCSCRRSSSCPCVVWARCSIRP